MFIKEISFKDNENALRDLCKKMVLLDPNNDTAPNSYTIATEKILQALNKEYTQDSTIFFKLLEEKDDNGISPRFLATQFAPEKIRAWLAAIYQQHQQNFYIFVPNSLEFQIFHKCKQIPPDENKIRKLRKTIVLSIQEYWKKPNEQTVVALHKFTPPESISIFDNETQKYMPTSIEQAVQKLGLECYTSSILIDPAWLSLLAFKRIVDTNNTGKDHVGLRHLGPIIGWTCFAQHEIPPNTPMGIYEGMITLSGAMDKYTPYGLEISFEPSLGKDIFINSQQIGGLMGRVAHLPDKKELDKYYTFAHFPWVKEYVATENISLVNDENSKKSSLCDNVTINKYHTNQAVKQGMVVGFSYGEEYFENYGLTPYLFDHYGNPIPRWFYSRQEMSFRHPSTHQITSVSYNEINLVDPHCQPGMLGFNPPPNLTMTQFNQVLIEQGYLPPIPVYENPNNLLFELHLATARGDFNKIWYILKYDEKRNEILQHINDAEPSTGNTPLHKAATKGHLWIAIFLLLHSENKDPKYYLEKTNGQGKTPKQLAEEYGHSYFIEVMDKTVAWLKLNKQVLPQEVATVTAAIQKNNNTISIAPLLGADSPLNTSNTAISDSSSSAQPAYQAPPQQKTNPTH